jgi:hypothetical protein
VGPPSGLFSSGFRTKILYAFVFSPMLATFPAHLILLDYIILIIFSEQYKLCDLSCWEESVALYCVGFGVLTAAIEYSRVGCDE